MAHTWIDMEDKMGRKRTVAVGYGWFALLCGLFFLSCLPPLLRGNFAVALVTFLLTIFTAGLYGLIYPFFDHLLNYNFHYNNGYRSTSYRGKMSEEDFAELQARERGEQE